MAAAFTYPAEPHSRRHGPRGYADYHSFRPWLRDEFCFRCVYCLSREQWGRVHGEFSQDHFIPQCLDPQLETDYDNALYSCATCNFGKGVHRVANPADVLTIEQVVVHDDGSLTGLTTDAARLIRVLGLNDQDYRRWRRTWLRIIELAERYEPTLYRQLMGYPDDLPDLSHLRPPGGNSRPEGIDESYFERRKRGELAGTY